MEPAAERAAPPPLAERSTRLAAATVDELLQLAICLPAVLGATPALAQALADYSSGVDVDPYRLVLTLASTRAAALSALAAGAWAALTTWLVWKNGQSIGKRLLGIRVVRKDGSRASLARIFWLRNVVNAIPGWLPIVGFAYQLVDPLFIFQPSRQCLHDRIADTVVVKA